MTSKLLFTRRAFAATRSAELAYALIRDLGTHALSQSSEALKARPFSRLLRRARGTEDLV